MDSFSPLVIPLGRTRYQDAWQRQILEHQKGRELQSEGLILWTEHDPVITLGRHASRENILWSDERLATERIDLVQTDRGGEVTAHEPGQLVIYPILPVPRGKGGVREFVCALEKSTLLTLEEFGIRGHVETENPGVWVGPNKIAALGIRISGGYSYHGIAINVCNSLTTFSAVIPCGIQNRGVCSVVSVLGQKSSTITVAQVCNSFLNHFRVIFAKNLSKTHSECLKSAGEPPTIRCVVPI